MEVITRIARVGSGACVAKVLVIVLGVSHVAPLGRLSLARRFLRPRCADAPLPVPRRRLGRAGVRVRAFLLALAERVQHFGGRRLRVRFRPAQFLPSSRRQVRHALLHCGFLLRLSPCRCRHRNQ